MKYLVAAGNPFDGLDFIGPFEDAEDASNWAEDIISNSGVEWHVVPILSADEKIKEWEGAPF